MARKKLHREPVLKDWAEVNDALRSIHEYEHRADGDGRGSCRGGSTP